MRATVAADADAAADIRSGATVMIGGFGSAGQPVELIDALIRQGADDLTVVNNNAGNGDRFGRADPPGRVSKIICSFPRQSDSWFRRCATAPARSSSNWCPRATRGADTGRRGRDRRFFTPTGFWHTAGGGQERPG